MLLVSFAWNGQFYIRNFMLNANIQIILKKPSSFLSTLYFILKISIYAAELVN